MFAKLTGTIDTLSQGSLILDVNGVGYLVSASNRTLTRIGDKGSNCSLLIETVIREDAISLFGFCDALEKGWFTMLTKIQGVGAKAGLAILSVCPPENLASIIASQDKAALTQADGVGPKLAARILTELKDKVGDLALGQTTQNLSAGAAVTTSQNPMLDDALSALVNLGFARADAYMALSKVQQSANDDLNLSDMIKMGLKELNG
jgi:Holliday junction DNA helicase RuvA